MYCGTANFALPYSTHFECKHCSQLIEIPSNQSPNQSIVSSPSTPSCASTISSRCSSAIEHDSPSPTLPDLHLESSSEEEDEAVKQGNPVMKKRRRSNGKKRDPRQPKRAANAYILFCKHERPLLRAKRPDLPFAIIGQTLGDMWRQMSIEQRKPYELRAAKERERYKVEMHAFTSSTLRNQAAIEPLINQTLSQFQFPSLGNQTMSNQTVNPDVFHALNASNQRSMMPSMLDSAFQQSINRSIKQQTIPLMVQQAQQSFIQNHYHPYTRPSQPQYNQPPMNEAYFNQTMNNQSNNQFVYGPVKRERRFSYQSISSINQFMNQPMNHGLISTGQTNNQPMVQSMNQPLNQTQNPFVFENFSSLEPPMNPSFTQSINQFDFPNDCLDLGAANFGLWEPAFDEI